MRITGALSGSLSARLASAGAAFGLHVMLARLAGADEYGTYSYVLAWVGVLVLVSTLGLDLSLVKFVAAYRAHADWRHLQGVVRWSRRVVLTTACATGIIVALAANLSRGNLETSLFHSAWIACCVLPVMATLRLTEARLLGLKHVVLAQLPSGVLRPLLTAGMAALLFWLPGRPMRGPDAMILHLLALTAAAVTGAELLRRVFRPPSTGISACYEKGVWLRVSLPLWFEAGLRLLSASLDVILVGTLLGATEAGIYAIANRLAELIRFGTHASQATVRPYISTFHAEANNPAMQRAVTTASTWATLFAVATCGALIPFRTTLLQQFGEEFLLGSSVLLVLSLGNLVAAGTAVVHSVMNMTDHQHASMRISAACLAVKLPLSLLSISHWGITGAAVVSSSVTAVGCLWSWGYVRRTLDIDGSVFSWFRRVA